MNEEMTLYDMSKMIAANEPPMDAIMLNKKCLAIAEDLGTKHYLMLLCHERRDYTIFNIDNDKAEYSKIAEELRETLLNRGKVIFADKQDDGAWEIWVRDLETEENFSYYLFDYTLGVIEV